MWQTKNYWYFKPSNAYSYSCYNSEEKKKSISMYLLNYQFVIMSLDINFPRKVILINL